MPTSRAAAHEPVLVAEVLAALQPRAEGIFVDCTFGRGGHTRALLQQMGPDGRVLAMDRDPAAVAAGCALARADGRLTLVQAPFSRLGEEARVHGIAGHVAGVLFDLGVSSPQLEDTARGFSFQADGPLDMRMDPASGESAAQWLARASEREIADVLRNYGEERHARRIARALVAARRVEPLTRTAQLAAVVRRANPSRERERDPATRTFQAVRIFVNCELDELRAGLDQVIEVLAPGGRFAVISFHSLEDRIVKRFIRDHSRPRPQPAGLPPLPAAPPPLRALGKPLRPRPEEIRYNPRARSAVLRAAEKRA